MHLMIFWDYDTQWGADRSRAGGGRKTWGSLEFEGTDKVLALHAEHHVPACFAVVGAAAAMKGARPYHDADQVRRIHQAGHEIASHSHRHEWLPGLSRAALTETLARSKGTLEQCIGGEVVSFVPPFNQPFDYPGGLSFSIAERREAGSERTDVRRLCDTLGSTGFKFCRLAFQSILERMVERFRGESNWRTGGLRRISGILCARLSFASGFRLASVALRKAKSCEKRMMVVYGHPHAVTTRGDQHEECLASFLRIVAELRDSGQVMPVLPRDLLRTTGAGNGNGLRLAELANE